LREQEPNPFSKDFFLSHCTLAGNESQRFVLKIFQTLVTGFGSSIDTLCAFGRVVIHSMESSTPVMSSSLKPPGYTSNADFEID